ncbi:MAG: hypothetical protein ACLR3S_06770 [Clostridium fessum]
MREGFWPDECESGAPTADGLARLAPGKTRDKILRPMRQIQTGIARQLEQEGVWRAEGHGFRRKSAEKFRFRETEIWNWW